MKLITPTLLFSLFSSLSHAIVTINNVPSHLRVGQEVVLSWSSDADYKTKSLAIWQVRDNGHTVHHVTNIEHTRATLSGNHSELWKIPEVRKNGGPYQIYFEGTPLDLGSMPGDAPALNASAKHAIASSNVFEIEGGVALFPKEIAGIVVGSLAAAALLVGLYVVGARILRKRKTVELDLPGPGEGGYSDVREV